MGYESRLYVVNKMDENYGDVIAAFNMGSLGNEVSRFKEFKETNLRFLGVDNHRFITVDDYGKKLNEIQINDAISIINDAREECYYRRYLPCLAFLLSIDKRDWNEVVVLHYGY